MNSRERRIAAESSGTAPGTTPANSPRALYETAVRHFLAGRPADARHCCQQALAIDEGHADSLHLMGRLFLQSKQHDQAAAWITRAIRQDPKPEYLASLGTTLQQQGQLEDALKVVDKAIQLSPEDAELWKQLGDILLQQERFEEALLTFQHTLQFNPRHQDALYKSGALLGQFQRHDEAIACLDLSSSLLPDHVPTLQARARTLYNLKRPEESLSDGERAHQLDPNDADTCNYLGMTLQRLGRDEEALEWFDKALKIRPNFVAATNNKIVSLHQLHRFEDVFATYKRMKAIGGANALTEWNVSLSYLLTGDFEAGWPRHHARLKLPSAKYPEIPLPMWLGHENIDGKTILVAADEGLGDTIQFVRYVPMLAERGANVLLVVQDPLHSLLSSLNGGVQCAPMSAVSSLPAFDFHCPISSLPLAFGTRLDTIPSAKSYLPLPARNRAQAWDHHLGPRTRPRVGLVWSGNPDHLNDHNRSISLRTLSRILDVDATFVSLQKDLRSNDATALRERNDMIDLTTRLTDFAETAALISCLDLVITVDTSVAHLSGALGVPTWIVLPYTPDYRWLLDREDSPWYPTARLFRQTASRDYDSVLDRIRQELQALILAFKSETPQISQDA